MEKKIYVSDIMQDEENEPNTVVSIEGRNKEDDFGAFHYPYYRGELQSIPEYLQNCEVLQTGWLMGAKCHVIEIPYLYDNRYYDPNMLTSEDRKIKITLEEKQREVAAYYKKMRDTEQK